METDIPDRKYSTKRRVIGVQRVQKGNREAQKMNGKEGFCNRQQTFRLDNVFVHFCKIL